MCVLAGVRFAACVPRKRVLEYPLPSYPCRTQITLCDGVAEPESRRPEKATLAVDATAKNPRSILQR